MRHPSLALATAALLIVVALPLAISLAVFARIERRAQDRADRRARGEVELRVSNPGAARLALYRAGQNQGEAVPVAVESFTSAWLPPARYFLEANGPQGRLLYPVTFDPERPGPNGDGSLDLVVRPMPPYPTPPTDDGPGFVYVPSGPFEIGDRSTPRLAHHPWVAGFFIATFETTNGEFRRFLADPGGYDDRANWTDAGWAWRARAASQTTARLTPSDPRFPRFGRDPLPVVLVTWYEADAYCRWLTRRFGGGRFWYRLPTEGEWEKAARGPDGFDYGLGMALSEPQAALYNWRKNPDADPTVVGAGESLERYRANRYGLYHMSGNAAEWTASLYRHYNVEQPYREDDRNDRALPGMRVTRGGSWYSAANVRLNLAYREEFQPDMSSDDLGFRVAAVPLVGPLR
ncbi:MULTISPECIES: formylglycine-generating enzyme family protein [Anaeromyxobacter]|nr:MULTISPECIES: SUMF1/EgtB/PvdO family nonheme iron enzyme [unclassified Anaeromyxobacter]